MSRVLSLAGFQVSFIGRFWVITEGRPLIESGYQITRIDNVTPVHLRPPRNARGYGTLLLATIQQCKMDWPDGYPSASRGYCGFASSNPSARNCRMYSSGRTRRSTPDLRI